MQAFVRAAMRGAAYAAANVEAAIEIVLTPAEGADASHQRDLLETDLRNAQRADGMGRATLDQWEALQAVLLEFDPAFEGPVDVSTVFDGSFVDAIYNDDGTLK
ncbi:MAG: hypothetical protein F4Z25_08035 [Chloroflexi bacterium]|nr:hypothetical protein [Chloroflexota bacterium]